MKAIVVYESYWGNTASVARAIAFRLPTEKTRNDMAARPGKAPSPPDLSHPSMCSWLEAVPKGSGGGRGARAAAFETGFKLSPGGAAGTILKILESRGYQPAAKKQRFLVKGSYGPVREGELERAKSWGA